MAVQNFRDLLVWQKAMDYVELVYRCSARFPREERYGLTAQLRKSAVSVPSNIAEGQGRRTTSEFLRFLDIARGSLNESQTQILVACRLKYLSDPQTSDLIALATEVARLLNGLTNSLDGKQRSR